MFKRGRQFALRLRVGYHCQHCQAPTLSKSNAGEGKSEESSEKYSIAFEAVNHGLLRGGGARTHAPERHP